MTTLKLNGPIIMVIKQDIFKSQDRKFAQKEPYG